MCTIFFLKLRKREILLLLVALIIGCLKKKKLRVNFLALRTIAPHSADRLTANQRIINRMRMPG
jgi:hypothetical protein